jgi:surface protein
MSGMFQGCSQLRTITGINNFNLGNTTNLNDMFNSCNSLQSIDLSNWNTSNVFYMSGLFSYMQSDALIKIDLSNFNTKKLMGAEYMFNWCIYLQEIDIRNFELVHEDNTEAGAYGMLEGCNSLTTLRLDNCSNATISKIINESGMPQEPYYDGNTGENVNRKMYCKASEIGDLVAPNGWEFVTVE